MPTDTAAAELSSATAPNTDTARPDTARLDTALTDPPPTDPVAPHPPAADPDQAPGDHRQAAQHAVAANTTRLDLHLGSTEVHLTLPPLDKMAFYAGLAGAAAFGVVEWPIALLTGIGHLLSDDRRNRTLKALGEALDAV